MLKRAIVFTAFSFLLTAWMPAGSTEKSKKEVAGYCSMMTSAANIPPGYHPVTVDWKRNDPRGDLVCISKTQGKEIRFTPWLDFPMPQGYYVLYTYPNPSTTFNGCRRWSVFNGQYSCIDMYPSYQLRKASN